jgi:hypothetical protein
MAVKSKGLELLSSTVIRLYQWQKLFSKFLAFFNFNTKILQGIISKKRREPLLETFDLFVVPGTLG